MNPYSINAAAGPLPKPAPRAALRSARRAVRMLGAAMASACMWLALPALAQTPLKIITTDQPGGGMDSLIRPMAERLGRELGRPVIVENKPGGRSQIAAQAVLQSPADGNTVFISVQTNFVVNPHVYKYNYDPLNDFVPVTDLGRGSLLLVVNPQVPAKTVKELIEWVKTRPKGSVNYASYSIGSLSHFGGVLLNQSGGIEMLHVPYKASPDALKDLIPGTMQVMWDGPATSTQFVKAGRLRALAYMGTKRMPLLPDVPTIREAGYPEIENDGWIGVFAAKGTPLDAISKIRDGMAKVLAAPEIKSFYGNFGFEPGGMPTADFARLIKSDYERWGKFIKAIGYTGEP